MSSSRSGTAWLSINCGAIQAVAPAAAADSRHQLPMRDNANPIAGGLSLGIVLHPEAATAAQPLQVLPVGAELALSP